jgi:Peptidase family M23
VQGRLFAPLQGRNPADVTQGGYTFLSPTDFVGGVPQTLHCGVDLNSSPPSGAGCNADEGLPVVAMLAGVIRKILPWTGASGEGNHLWYEVEDDVAPGPSWVHMDHLQSFACSEGQRVSPGDVIGFCGRSGGWECSHVHLEILPAPPAQGWYQWPYGWSEAQVRAAYYWPRAWWDAAAAKVGQAPPEIVSMILSGAQAAAVQAVVWESYWEPAAADFAIPTAWRDEWRRGVWRGAPLSSEQLVPEDAVEGKPAGSWQLFQYGAAVWLPGQSVSWNG